MSRTNLIKAIDWRYWPSISSTLSRSIVVCINDNRKRDNEEDNLRYKRTIMDESDNRYLLYTELTADPWTSVSLLLYEIEKIKDEAEEDQQQKGEAATIAAKRNICFAIVDLQSRTDSGIQ